MSTDNTDEQTTSESILRPNVYLQTQSKSIHFDSKKVYSEGKEVGFWSVDGIIQMELPIATTKIVNDYFTEFTYSNQYSTLV